MWMIGEIIDIILFKTWLLPFNEEVPVTTDLFIVPILFSCKNPSLNLFSSMRQRIQLVEKCTCNIVTIDNLHLSHV